MNSKIKERIEKIEQGVVPEGYKKSKIGIIPEDWEVKELGEVRDFNDRYSFAGGPFGSNLKVSDYCNEGIRVIQLQNIGDGYFDDNNIIYTSVGKADELISSNIYPGDIIIAKMAEPLARACIIPDNKSRYLMASDGIRLKTNNDNNTLFIKEIINSKKFRRKAYELGTGTTRKRISLTDLRNIEIPTPPLQEQEKIADILSTWDKAIEKIENLIKEKEIQKKGLMQQLLTGETRLPGFRGEWKEVKLGEVTETKSGSTPKRTNKSYYGGDIPWVVIADMTSQQKYLYETKDHITEDGFKNSSVKLYKENTILYAMYASIGECVVTKIPVTSNQAIINIEPHEILDVEFLYYHLISIKTKIKLQGQQGTQSNLNSIIVKDFRLNLPPLPEQKAIADILSTADKEIELLKGLLQNKKEEKNGLMQLLLTGLVRV